jgi:transcription elongation factor Elf1
VNNAENAQSNPYLLARLQQAYEISTQKNKALNCPNCGREEYMLTYVTPVVDAVCTYCSADAPQAVVDLLNQALMP